MIAARIVMVVAVLAWPAACDSSDFAARMLGRRQQPDELPVMLNGEPPFRYPPALYAQRIQGNVSLRLFVDEEGRLHSESTSVAVSSGYPALDSAALAASRELMFAPARRKEKAIPVTIIYPVYFRHPDMPPLAGDTILRRGTRRGGRGDTT